MAFLDKIRDMASRNLKTVVLPESDDERTIEAVDEILDKKLARIILVGKDDVRKKVKTFGVDHLDVVDPLKCKDLESMISEYYELRKAKGMTPDEAKKAVSEDSLIFGAMLVRRGLAAGFVAGANHTTPSVIRASLRCLQIDKSVGVVSGAFLMEVPHSQYGENGVFVFADCGVNPDPNPRQLAGIAVSSARLFKQLVGKKPIVALLSYSTKGSAEGDMVEKVRKAVERAKEMAPDIAIDGEFQVDSALVPKVALLKCANSEVAGKANVLIFPDLTSGNICYKMTQRLAGARAIGPLLTGFTKPCSDLSRGCSAEDIVDAVAITALRS